MGNGIEAPAQASVRATEQEGKVELHLVNRPFTPKDLADRWQVSESKVRRLAAKGDLVSFKIGTLYRFTREAVRAFEQAPAKVGPKDAGPPPDESPPPDRASCAFRKEAHRGQNAEMPHPADP